jgi:hypothetical protein
MIEHVLILNCFERVGFDRGKCTPIRILVPSRNIFPNSLSSAVRRRVNGFQYFYICTLSTYVTFGLLWPFLKVNIFVDSPSV